LSINPSPENIFTNSSINRILELSHNERWLICGCEGLGIQVFDLNNRGADPLLLHAHQNRVRSIAIYSNDQQMLTSGIENKIMKWNFMTGENETFYESNSPVQALAISSNDQYFAAGTKNGKLLLFSGQEDESPEVLLNDPGNQILFVLFRRKDNLLISGDQRGIIRMWSLNLMDQVFSRKLHQARIVEIKSDPSERYIATSSTDGRVFVLDMDAINKSAIEVASMNGFIFSIEFINEEKNLIIATEGSTPLVGYPILSNDLAEYFCPNINRNLTVEEWRNYVRGHPI